MGQQLTVLSVIPLPGKRTFYGGISGFTIIELLITVAIAGVLMGVATPALRNLLLNQKVRTATSDIHVGLLLARSEAIKRNVDVELDRNTSWSDGWDVEVQATSATIRTQDGFPGITITCNTDNDTAAEACPATVEFSRAGRYVPPSAAETIMEFRVFVNGNTNVTARCVSLRLSGMPQVTVDTDQNSGDGCD